MSVLRSLLLLAALPLLLAADEPGAERRRAPTPVEATPARPPPAAPIPVTAPPAKAPPTKAPPTKATPTASTTPPRALRVFRFDALRVEGLAGPGALVLHDLQLGRRRSLVQRRRSFLHRMLAAVEVGPHGRP